ncbi:MAG: dienelactone hydrolase family protein [Bacteroidetes bacterium]|nr:dienelactone hydrolase family protein [Bacteroidota bacterium]
MRHLFLPLICSILLLIPAVTRAQTAAQQTTASVFIDALIGHQWDRLESLSHPSLREKITRDKWETLINDLVAKAGPVQSHRLVSATPNGSYASIIHNVLFEKDSLAFRVVVDSLNLVGGFWLDPIKKEYRFLPPAYADTNAFTERELTVGKGGEYPLPATLTVPKGKGPFPAAVLVHGSGPSDRDETIAGNKIFRDIAWGLASRGVMVLRYEKRTKQYGSKMNRYKVTVQEETIDDALLAIALLKQQPEADTTHLTLIGHSLGAMLAPEIAAHAPSVDAVAMLAPIARPLEVVISDQLRFIASMQDTISAEEQAKLDAELDKAKQIQDGSLMPTKTLLNMPATYFYDLHKRDQHAYARALGRPIFIARGTKDYQAPQMDYIMWQDILKDVPHTAFRTYDNCYHLFIPTDARPGPWNYQQEGHVVESLIDDLTSWCKTFTLPDDGGSGK